MQKDKKEHFKGGMSAGSKAVLAGAGVGALSSGTGAESARCPLDDKSFYCTLTRSLSELKMIIMIILIIIGALFLFYYLYKFLFSGKKKR
jgi:hypothetical protein